MKLRTQLILAFFLLAVLPLTGLTLYSYNSSLKAFRRVVEAESSALAEDMGRRMEAAIGDLNRRIDRLGDLPFLNLLRADAEKVSPDARLLYSNLLEEMGEAAVFVESLEFKPALTPPPGEARFAHRQPEPPKPPVAGPPTAKADLAMPESVVIYMHEIPSPPDPVTVYAAPTEETSQAASGDVSVYRSDENRLIVRRRGGGTRRGVRPPDPDRAQRIAEVRLQHLEEAARKVEEKTAEVSRALAKGDEEAGKELEVLTQKAADLSARQTKIKILLENKFDSSVRVAGELMGTVQAQVDAQQVLHQVLQKTLRRQGEIPFAVDSEGRLYTPYENSLTELNELKTATAGFSVNGLQQAPRDWVVATREAERFGLTLGIARPVAEPIQEIRNTAVRNLGYGLVMIGVALLGILPLSRRMTRNLTVLTDGAEQLAAGDLKTRVPVRSGDEFGRLAQTFNRMAHDLEEHQQHLVKQERLQKELEMCRQIQDELLPRNPLRLSFAEVKGISIPAREVGGDFFNYFALPDGDVAVLIGDVSGKGVAAALLMANLQATLRARLSLEKDLAKLAGELDQEIAGQTPPETFLTLFMGLLRSSGRVLEWVNAGHTTQYLLEAKGTLKRLESTGRPLGLLPGCEYTAQRLELQSGDSLFLYTDGLTDAANSGGEEFGVGRLESILPKSGESGLDAMLAEVEQAVRQHRQGAEAGDDATMMVLRIGSC